MSTRFGIWTLRVGVFGLTLAGIAAAQPREEVELGQTEEVELSPSEMRAKATSAVAEMDAATDQVRTMLSQAKEDRDVVKVLCLDDKSNQIETALSAARERADAMSAAQDRNSAARAHHEFTLLGVLRERVSTLVSEANQCVGEETGFTGDTEVDVEIDSNLPTADPNTLPLAPVVAVPPSVSSPTD